VPRSCKDLSGGSDDLWSDARSVDSAVGRILNVSQISADGYAHKALLSGHIRIAMGNIRFHKECLDPRVWNQIFHAKKVTAMKLSRHTSLQ
jgi:hypothetical protein